MKSQAYKLAAFAVMLTAMTWLTLTLGDIISTSLAH